MSGGDSAYIRQRMLKMEQPGSKRGRPIKRFMDEVRRDMLADVMAKRMQRTRKWKWMTSVATHNGKSQRKKSLLPVPHCYSQPSISPLIFPSLIQCTVSHFLTFFQGLRYEPMLVFRCCFSFFRSLLACATFCTF